MKCGLLLTELLRIPKAWAGVIAITAILSAFELGTTADGRVTAAFRINAITVGLMALLWLPAVLRFIALAGGGLKALGVEASTPGLWELLRHLDTGTQREALPSLIATVDQAARDALPPDRARLHAVGADLEAQLRELSGDVTEAKGRLIALARTYESMRSRLEPGPARTFRMTEIVVSARALAPQAHLAHDEIRGMLQSGAEGDRLIALAVLQITPFREAVDDVIDAVDASKSAFEQYQSLLALRRLSPVLTASRRTRAASAIVHQRSGRPGTWISPEDSSRWNLSEQLLAVLERDS